MRQRGFQIADIYAHAYYISTKSPQIAYIHLTRALNKEESGLSQHFGWNRCHFTGAEFNRLLLFVLSLPNNWLWLSWELTNAHRETNRSQIGLFVQFVCAYYPAPSESLHLEVVFLENLLLLRFITWWFYITQMHTSIFFYSQGTGGVFTIFVLEWKERDKILSVVFFPYLKLYVGS